MAAWAAVAVAGASATDNYLRAEDAEDDAKRDRAAAETKAAAAKRKQSEERMSAGNKAQQRIAAERSMLARTSPGSGSSAKAGSSKVSLG